MVEISYKNGKERNQSLTAESMIKIWVSPSTTNAGDTVVLPEIKNRTPRVISCSKNGTQVAAPIEERTVTLESGGSATSQIYVLTYFYE